MLQCQKRACLPQLNSRPLILRHLGIAVRNDAAPSDFIKRSRRYRKIMFQGLKRAYFADSISRRMIFATFGISNSSTVLNGAESAWLI